jgi:regulator of sigma E protease
LGARGSGVAVLNILHWLLPIIGIGFVIFFHELGHFMAARAMGVRVEAFSIGFGPRLFGFRRGATDWKICLIPLGGFVKMAGETPNAPRTGASDEFSSKSVAARSLIISAGVIMNVIFALIALPIAFMIGVPFEAPKVGSVDVESPAWKAGIRAGDRVKSVDGRRTLGYEDVVTAIAIGGDVVAIELERAGRPLLRQVETERDPRRGLPVIGVNPAYAPVEIRTGPLPRIAPPLACKSATRSCRSTGSPCRSSPRATSRSPGPATSASSAAARRSR